MILHWKEVADAAVTRVPFIEKTLNILTLSIHLYTRRRWRYGISMATLINGQVWALHFMSGCTVGIK
jgi:hypothetical protein